MVSVLLDHPWPILADRDPLSEGFGVLREFIRLVSKHRLSVVPFIEQREYQQILDLQTPPRTSGLAAVRRGAREYVRWAGGNCTATPHPEPVRLTPFWKCALRDALTDIEDWRNPQIIISQHRRPDWTGAHEVIVHLDPCGNEAESPPCPRVLATMESYADHPNALSDFDPWNQERFHAPSRVEARKCLLPKPPIVNIRGSLPQLDDSVIQARALGQRWENAGKYYFIPPVGWRAAGMCKADWRDEVFRNDELNGYRGPIDYKHRVWRWAPEHGQHWDLQFEGGDHLNINQNGDVV